jgi:adenosylcobinamide kinase/adenosylcobinamide-phosphate guanylyltransferase
LIHLVLGGARSGKSRYSENAALSLAENNNKNPIYIATATPFDVEMNERIKKHQQDRLEVFKLIETPLALSSTLNVAQPENVYLLDCLTLWLNNIIFEQQNTRIETSNVSVEHHIEKEIELLVQTLNRKFSNAMLDIIIVSNEVGLGIVPMGKDTRLFVDYCGWLNQKIAKIAQQVTLITAGIPLTLK